MFPLKVLLVSDLHYALKQYDWTAEVAADFDLVVVAGDHLDIAGQLDGSVQILVILKYLQRLATRSHLLVSSGNHDLDMRDDAGEKVASWMEQVRRLGIPADGESVTIDGTLVTICPWWDGPRSRDAVHRQIERDAAKPKERWIWVYHAPPDGSPTGWSGKRHYGDRELVEWIEAYGPDIVFTGHVHEAPFRDGGSWVDQIGSCWVFNCGQQIGPVPAHIMIDTQIGEAVWFSLAGAEIVDLDQPLVRPIAALSERPAWLARPSRGLDLIRA